MTKHIFMIKDELTGEIVEKYTTTWYGEWVGALWGEMIFLYENGLHERFSIVHLAPKPEECKTYRKEDIERFNNLFKVI